MDAPQVAQPMCLKFGSRSRCEPHSVVQPMCLKLSNCMQKRDFYTIHNANLVTDILTNPTVVHLHVKMHVFYSNHIANLVADILTNPTVVHPYVEINDAYPIHIANLVTDMLTNPTVVQLHIEMDDFVCNPHCKPCHRHAYKTYNCSIARKNIWILWQLKLQTLAQTCLQTLQLLNCT